MTTLRLGGPARAVIDATTEEHLVDVVWIFLWPLLYLAS